MEGYSSSPFSRSSGTTSSLAIVKAEPKETSEHHRSRGSKLVINEGHCQPSPPRGDLFLVRLTKDKEPAKPPVVVKQDHTKMAADLDTVLESSCDDYVREEMERQRCALEEIAAWRRGSEEGGVIVLDDNNEETPVHTTPF
ncbi:hypothetical protein D1007_48937 [Hordeum vulgare]|nr:hypothetical protein D1007_48937 [Hordeum vulgare]